MASTLAAVNDDSELGGVSGPLTPEEVAALLAATIHPALRRLLEAFGDRPEGE